MNIYSRTPFYYRRNHGGILLLERADVYTLHVVPRALRRHFRVLARRPNQVYCQGFPRHYANRFSSSQQNHFHSISSPFSSLRVGQPPMSSLSAVKFLFFPFRSVSSVLISGKGLGYFGFFLVAGVSSGSNGCANSLNSTSRE